MDDGSFLRAGMHGIINLPSEMIPIFIKEGSIIFWQKTENVTKTRQLDNVFGITLAMKSNEDVSNTTTKVYKANGTILSIKNYNNDTNINTCLNQACFYQLSATMISNNGKKSLTIDVFYAGALKLNEEVII